MLEVRTQRRVIYPQDTGRRIQLIGGHRGVRKMSGERERERIEEKETERDRERSRKAVVLVILKGDWCGNHDHCK